MASHAPHLTTLEDLYHLPDDDHRYELHAGYVIREPPPGARHGRIALTVAATLRAFVLPRRLGVVLTNVSFLLARDPDTVRGPDVAFVTRERYLRLEDESRVFPGAPDLAIEILSPGHRAREMDTRIRDLIGAGTQSVWLCDPKTATAQVIDASDPLMRREYHDQLTADTLLPGFSLDLDDVFRLDL